MTPSRRSLTIGLCVLALVCGAGCNVLSLPFFILGPEPKVPAQLRRLATDDKEQEVTVVVLAVNGLETRTELIRADRELEAQVVSALRAGCKYNEENVKVVSPTKVQEFKSEHPDWRKWGPEEIGKHFKADWVVWLEIGSMSLYEKGSNNQLYRGRAEVNVSLVDVNNPEEPAKQKFFSGSYPGDGRPAVEAGDSNPSAFRQAFLAHMAEQISWYFTAHPTSKDYSCQ